MPQRMGCIYWADVRGGRPSNRRGNINKRRTVRLEMRTDGGQNILAQGLHCREESVKTVENLEARLGSSHSPEVSMEATKAGF